jgi:hypothetical protein
LILHTGTLSECGVPIRSKHVVDKLSRGLIEAVRGLPVDSALIDGKAVAFLPGGYSDFAALRTKAGRREPPLSPSIFSALRATIFANAPSRGGERRSRTWS